ncbi:MAG: DUF1330 domain-containing protein [Gammaproteobacteria bacterium]|jgi:uncharacterized protein (DUF1330 family)|nr:DUF1330 domain-containing protein [Gammaproteobacteria bacterium]MDB2444298.1 DUF1330 domain-containing protein [Gammaproteobacteria bacterium]MDC3239117.1 DUF1330 domain-containing protein [Gammaproteobacteria bacterium]MDG0998826.1 DUF1330 domain-containing protein [Gammaproteobacteria bacterium]MDG1951563.1 DUF1330 domain-containing protein [Gammaproteobacteria bacterium]|tara:strand:+ start:1308 stop:1610 length:303 start_codon:yes stop_codon:yes gene_type:complete
MAKGYWINHVEKILDPERFSQYVKKWEALVESGEAKIIVLGKVARTQIGATKMHSAVVVEFETFEKAISFKNDPKYLDALAELGDDETEVVIRTSCVVSE